MGTGAMHASIRRYEGLDKDTTAEAVKLGMDLRRVLSERAGFVAYEVIVTENGFLSITVFETELTALESNAVAAVWIREHIPRLGLPTPEIITGEVYEDPESGRQPFTREKRSREPAPEIWSTGRGF